MRTLASSILLVALAGCPAEWASKSGGLRQPLTFCAAASFADVIAKGRIVAASPPRVVTFKVWPGLHRTTPLSVEVKKDLRGRLAPGMYPMFVGAPVSLNGREVETFTASEIGAEGWLTATLVEGRWIMGLDGLVTSDPSSSKYETRLGTFEREEDFEAAQVAAFAECPRIDVFADDGGRADWANMANENGSSDAGP